MQNLDNYLRGVHICKTLTIAKIILGNNASANRGLTVGNNTKNDPGASKQPSWRASVGFQLRKKGVHIESKTLTIA